MTTLLLGTTGMLSAAAAHAVARSKKAVIVSRHADAFSFNNDVLDHKITAINVSYDDEAAFLDALEPLAPFDLALTWMHPPADILRAALDGMIASGGTLVEVMGSRSILLGKNGEASIAERRAQALALQPDITYAQVILGFVIEGATSRWLTHEEISAAAIEQLQRPRPRLVAGTLEPWDRRPK
ncbi:MAG: hypothetical protein WA943_03760 [Parvibaculum sp.]|uniref:hypothetical protein n=1 Tax=Parvibaculum sp. TaxID=2024848 RepID=UPI003C78CEB1